jgi:pullulanase
MRTNRWIPIRSTFILTMLIILTLLGSFFLGCSQANQNQQKNDELVVPEIPDQTVRVHYIRPAGDYENFVLWLWEDTTWEAQGGWPNGLEQSGRTSYGVYFDVPVKSNAARLGMVVVDKSQGDAGKDGGDKVADFSFPRTRELWILQGDDQVYLYRPIELASNTLRVHYTRADGNYENMVLWLWNDTTWEAQGGWPNGLEKSGIDEYGAYYDVPLKDRAATIGMVVVDKTLGDPGKDGGDRIFSLLSQYNRVWIRQGDNEVYVTPTYEKPIGILSAVIASDSLIEAMFLTTQGLTQSDLRQNFSITTKDGAPVQPTSLRIAPDNRRVIIELPVDLTQAPYQVRYDERTVQARAGWQYIDALYAYEGRLGAQLNADGTALIKLWSPMVKDVQLRLYDKTDQDKVIADIPMTRGDNGVWSVVLNRQTTGLSSVRGYYYHYRIDAEGTGTYRLALDPYAQSMAPFNNRIYDIGKAAIVDVSTLGPQLSFAQIPGFQKREDAIIWEIHVRDFTVDPSIEDLLTHPFGTFQAMIDKLDYIQALGVTHVQLLPVMSYKWGNELASRTREMTYSAQGNNYNWGYDPHSYFSLTGMYSSDPRDPELRIIEFKGLVDAIHQRGMGVILDVVYNHTADVRIFEDLAPGYYHFMDRDGTPRTSFGGGRLGTTHAMSRRILVDSILYWTREFKVDGFRFDMMGDHDAEAIQIAYDRAKELNPNVLMIGEGWRTFVGDEGDPRRPADQDWMAHTDSVAVFSDEFRNELKSGFGSEGQPMFITGGPRNIQTIFRNIKAQPTNFVADDPGDVVPYIAAHDNLTLHDVIAQSIKKDPDVPENHLEIHRRIRLGNTMVLTSQGVAFLHAGQEYGRTKQWRAPGKPEQKETYMTNAHGTPFRYPWFIHDSYDSTDIVNMFDWTKATNSQLFPEPVRTRDFTAGLVALRRSTDAFRLGTKELVDQNVTLIQAPEIQRVDLIIGYRSQATDGTAYYTFINADEKQRRLTLDVDLRSGEVLVDGQRAGTNPIQSPLGVEITRNAITLAPLTATVIRVR